MKIFGNFVSRLMFRSTFKKKYIIFINLHVVDVGECTLTLYSTQCRSGRVGCGKFLPKQQVQLLGMLFEKKQKTFFSQ